MMMMMMMMMIYGTDVQMRQTNELDWDEPDAAEAAPLPPQMVINIVSNDVLQLTVTKAVLDVFTNLSQVDLASRS